MLRDGRTDRHEMTKLIEDNLANVAVKVFLAGVHNRCVSQVSSNCALHKKPVYTKNTLRKRGRRRVILSDI
jgi:hypothetical protein